MRPNQYATEKDLEEILTYAETLRLPCVGLIPELDRFVLRNEESFIGGWPYWPVEEPYPIASTGGPMIFLAQINFSEMPPLPDYPTTGLLQIFVDDAHDYCFGCKFPSFGDDGFRVIYRPAFGGVAQKDFAIFPNIRSALFQLYEQGIRGTPLTFKTQTMLPLHGDWRIEKKLSKFGYPRTSKEFDYFYERMGLDRQIAHYVGGHPKFVQSDIREVENNDFDRVLLQLGYDNFIMWGDSGEANFLIKLVDLKNQNFKNCFFNWDCH
ncbi:MAG: DUF1963 domain-containing protein [Chitinophagales bacterium]|nr:DUF1963 domain-containing protein [Hyphomicrobiales bacterium]